MYFNDEEMLIFFAEYERLLRDAKGRLGTIFNPADYPLEETGVFDPEGDLLQAGRFQVFEYYWLRAKDCSGMTRKTVFEWMVTRNENASPGEIAAFYAWLERQGYDRHGPKMITNGRKDETR